MVRKTGLLAFALGLLSVFIGAATSSTATNTVYLVQIDGPIDSMVAKRVARGIDRAESEDARLVVIQMDTPGGLVVSTRDIVASILASDVPVAVFVAPGGAQAASAGTFVTAAANFAVMAPGTNIGAASPINGDGGDIEGTLGRKVNEDTRAFIRSIAQERGRNGAAL